MEAPTRKKNKEKGVKKYRHRKRSLSQRIKHKIDPKKLIKIEADFDVEIEDDETGMEVY